jgi:hypothetical protein
MFLVAIELAIKLVVVYSNKTYWRNQGCVKGIQEWSTLLNHHVYIYDGQGNQLSPGHKSILGLPPVSSARFIVGTLICSCVLNQPSASHKIYLETQDRTWD